MIQVAHDGRHLAFSTGAIKTTRARLSAIPGQARALRVILLVLQSVRHVLPRVTAPTRAREVIAAPVATVATDGTMALPLASPGPHGPTARMMTGTTPSGMIAAGTTMSGSHAQPGQEGRTTLGMTSQSVSSLGDAQQTVRYAATHAAHATMVGVALTAGTMTPGKMTMRRSVAGKTKAGNMRMSALALGVAGDRPRRTGVMSGSQPRSANPARRGGG